MTTMKINFLTQIGEFFSTGNNWLIIFGILFIVLVIYVLFIPRNPKMPKTKAEGKTTIYSMLSEEDKKELKRERYIDNTYDDNCY